MQHGQAGAGAAGADVLLLPAAQVLSKQCGRREQLPVAPSIQPSS